MKVSLIRSIAHYSLGQPPYYVIRYDVGGLSSVLIMWVSQVPLPWVRKTMCTDRFQKYPDPQQPKHLDTFENSIDFG